MSFNKFYLNIQYIGPEEEASQVKYTFVLESWAGEITVCSVTSMHGSEGSVHYG